MTTPPTGRPTITVHSVPLDTLLTDPANARLHSPRNVDAIRASLRQFGQQHPLVVDKHQVIVAGNGRYEAMVAEGWERADVVVFPGTATEARAFAIADNRSAELAHWDVDALLSTLQSIEDADLQLAAGFDADDMAVLVQRLGAPPSLDDLGAEHGAPTASDLWPTLRLTVPQELIERYRDTVAHLGGAADDAEALSKVLDAVEVTT